MKLVIITAVNQYKVTVQRILKKLGIHNYSYQEVVGHRDVSSVADADNWFVGDRFESQSIVFMIMAPEAVTQVLFDEVNRFNENLETLSKVHVSILGIEKMN